MLKLFTGSLLFIIIFSAKVEAVEDTSNHIYLNLKKKEVCSNRANKCWPVALGRSSHPTPNIEGPTFITTIHRNGFNWSDPFSGKYFKKGTHNLGNIWIGFTNVGPINIGFHQTPTPNIALSNQESLGGCIRMYPKDIKEFSSYVNYLDEVYTINK
jgi:lipoprotein-anchoring transpeptidase ErfK/SrfK